MFPQPELAKRTYDLVLGPDVKNQDLYALYFPLINYRVQSQAWEFFKSDFPAIMKKVDGPDAVSLAQAAERFATPGSETMRRSFLPRRNCRAPNASCKTQKIR